MIPKRRIFRLSPEARNILLVSATCFGITAGAQVLRPGASTPGASPRVQQSAPTPPAGTPPTAPSHKAR